MNRSELNSLLKTIKKNIEEKQLEANSKIAENLSENHDIESVEYVNYLTIKELINNNPELSDKMSGVIEYFWENLSASERNKIENIDKLSDIHKLLCDENHDDQYLCITSKVKELIDKNIENEKTKEEWERLPLVERIRDLEDNLSSEEDRANDNEAWLCKVLEAYHDLGLTIKNIENLIKSELDRDINMGFLQTNNNFWRFQWNGILGKAEMAVDKYKKFNMEIELRNKSYAEKKDDVCDICNGKKLLWRHELPDTSDWDGSSDDTLYLCPGCKGVR